MSVETRARPRPRGALWLLIGVLAIGAVAAILIPRPPPTAYRFITRHPISVTHDRNGRWFYYMEDGQRTVAQVADTVRAELLPLGFHEDRTNGPWFRFVKGAREVIVCRHDEIATYPSGLADVRVRHGSGIGVPGTSPWPVLWVYEPGRDPLGVLAFRIRAFVFRW